MKEDTSVFKKIMFALGMVVLLHVSLGAVGGSIASVATFVDRSNVTPATLEDSLTGENQYVCGNTFPNVGLRACNVSDVLTEVVFPAFFGVPILAGIFSLAGALYMLGLGGLIDMPLSETFLSIPISILIISLLIIAYVTVFGQYWYRHVADKKRQKRRAFLIQFGVLAVLTLPFWVVAIALAVSIAG